MPMPWSVYLSVTHTRPCGKGLCILFISKPPAWLQLGRWGHLYWWKDGLIPPRFTPAPSTHPTPPLGAIFLSLFSGWGGIVLRASTLKSRDLRLLVALSLSSPPTEPPAQS